MCIIANMKYDIHPQIMIQPIEIYQKILTKKWIIAFSFSEESRRKPRCFSPLMNPYLQNNNLKYVPSI